MSNNKEVNEANAAFYFIDRHLNTKIENKNVFVEVIGNKNNVNHMVAYCKEIGLDLIGLMCIPPIDRDLEDYFKEMNILNKSFGFFELSMGMSSDFLLASEHSSTYVRIGSSIFGQRF